MKYKEKVDVLLSCVKGVIQLDAEQEQAAYAALVDGFLRIVQAETLQQKAEMLLHSVKCSRCGARLLPGEICACQKPQFDVELIDEGYGFWAHGGWNGQKKCGQFRIAVSPDGEPLKEVARMQEVNGRHVLNVVYPGCYIILSTCKQPPVIDTELYRVEYINRKDGKAVCERIDPEELEADERERLMAAEDVTRNECTTPFNKTNHYYWRINHE